MRVKSIVVSAPGKLMLFGEHAVVQGKPCIVTSVNQRLQLKAEKLEEKIFILDAPDVEIVNYRKNLKDLGKGEIPKGAKFIEIALSNFLKKQKIDGGVKITTVSQFKSVFGFGSSSASAVCLIKAVSDLFKIRLTNEEFFKIAYKTVIDIQGVGSGFDLAAAIYGGILYYVYPGKVIQPLKVNKIPLIVGYTGVKADTATLVKAVNAKAKKYPKIFKSIFDDIEIIVEEAKKVLGKYGKHGKEEELGKLGELMNLNQGYLEAMGVGSDKLANLIYAARNAGAYGAKLSGAGGGDCMICLASAKNLRNVKKAIEEAGGQVLDVQVNVEGVNRI